MDEKGDAMKGREANRQTLGDTVDWTTSNSKTRGVAPERIMTSTGGGWCGCGDGACVCLPGMKGWGRGPNTGHPLRFGLGGLAIWQIIYF